MSMPRPATSVAIKKRSWPARTLVSTWSRRDWVRSAESSSAL